MALQAHQAPSNKHLHGPSSKHTAHTDMSISGHISLERMYSVNDLLSTRTVKSASREEQSGEMMLVKFYALLNKAEQGTLENGNSELLSDADYIKAFQEISSFPIIFSTVHLLLQSPIPDFLKEKRKGVCVRGGGET